MRFKVKPRILLPALLILGASALTAVADPMGWFSKPVLTIRGEGNGHTVDYVIDVWKDGSAEYRVIPKAPLSDDKLPSEGRIVFNDKEFKFSRRETEDGKKFLFASLPVGTVPFYDDFTYSVEVYDGTGFLLVQDEGYQIHEP